MEEKIISDFELYFKENIYETALNFERKKKKTEKIFLNNIIILCILGFSLMFAPFMKSEPGTKFVLICTVIFLMIALPWILYENKYKIEVKKEIMSKLFNYLNIKIGDADTFQIKNYVKSLCVLPVVNKCKCDDYLIGEYKGIKVKMLDLLLARGKNDFRILLTSFDNPSKNDTKLIICPSYSVIYRPKEYRGLTLVNLEDIEFQKFYKVYSDNQIEARNMMTPVFIDKIVNRTKEKGYMSLSFEKGKVNIVEYPYLYQDFFDFNYSDDITDINNYIKIIKDIEYIYDFIEFMLTDLNISE